MDGEQLALRLDGVDKWYSHGKKAVHALKNVTLELTEGIYGLTGKNGAGKTTLMQVLTGYLQADRGEIYFNDKRVSTRSRFYKGLLGYMPQQQSVYETMSCIQFMNYMASMKALDRTQKKEQVPDMLNKVHLWEKRFENIGALSGGMKQRLLFAQACMGEPKLLLLDEPTAGVDPEERENLQKMIADNSSGKIVVLSTHILSDIETIAKEEIRMADGRVLDNE